MMQWVPGYCGLSGNELSDQRAKLVATVKDDAPHPLAFGNAVTAGKQPISDPPLKHGRTRSVYNQYSEQGTEDRREF